MGDETIHSLEVSNSLILPQGPSEGLYISNDSLHYNDKRTNSINEEKVSSVKYDDEKLIITLEVFSTVVEQLTYLMDIIDPAISTVKEILISNVIQPELSIKILDYVYSSHNVFLDIYKNIHII
jgi:hypothetical protein